MSLFSVDRTAQESTATRQLGWPHCCAGACQHYCPSLVWRPCGSAQTGGLSWWKLRTENSAGRHRHSALSLFAIPLFPDSTPGDIMSSSIFSGDKTLEDNKNALIKDLKGVVGDADKLLHQLVNSSTEEFSSARSKIESALSDSRAKLHDAGMAVSNKACLAADASKKYVVENPWKTVGLIAGFGLIIGILSQRR
jgi:ElaB/YqjD/DUF883 family membrane-anchored ribosome-binding protein